MSQTHLGIDIGGTGIKFGLVDLDTGQLVGERETRETPQPATPDAVARVLTPVVRDLKYEGPIGIGFPAVVSNNVVMTAINIDPSWVGLDVAKIIADATGRDVTVINDADAAALAEVEYGAAKDVGGLVVIITFGTGIGSGVVFDGRLIPNIELGGIELDGYRRSEYFYSGKRREIEDLSWEEWGARANRYLSHINGFLNPELIVVGGGVSKRWDMFKGQLDPSLPLAVAEIRNSAGIVGAALASMRSQTD